MINDEKPNFYDEPVTTEEIKFVEKSACRKIGIGQSNWSLCLTRKNWDEAIDDLESDQLVSPASIKTLREEFIFRDFQWTLFGDSLNGLLFEKSASPKIKKRNGEINNAKGLEIEFIKSLYKRGRLYLPPRRFLKPFSPDSEDEYELHQRTMNYDGFDVDKDFYWWHWREVAKNFKRPRGRHEINDQEEVNKIDSDFGFVYFIKNKDIFKIGLTNNLLKRFSKLKPDEVLNIVRCSNFEELEKILHKSFKENRIPQTEYFRLTPSQVNEVHQLMTTKAKF